MRCGFCSASSAVGAITSGSSATSFYIHRDRFSEHLNTCIAYEWLKGEERLGSGAEENTLITVPLETQV